MASLRSSISVPDLEFTDSDTSDEKLSRKSSRRSLNRISRQVSLDQPSTSGLGRTNSSAQDGIDSLKPDSNRNPYARDLFIPGLDGNFEDDDEFFNIDMAFAVGRLLEEEDGEERRRLEALFADWMGVGILENPIELLNQELRQPVDLLSRFNHGASLMTECDVCYDVKKLYKRKCCGSAVCDECLKIYLETQISEGVIQIMCIGTHCDVAMFREEILARISIQMKGKYHKFLVDANKDPKVKTCPKCNYIHKLAAGEHEQKTKYGLSVICPEKTCLLKWCFLCQAPWHEGIKCADYRKGDKLVAKWAKEKHYGNTNAQKCPKCKIYIERKGGCDHMVCSKCNQSFCYRCGGRYIDLKFFGNHLSRFSPLGCKYQFKPDQPVLRRAVRGSVLGAKIIGGIFLVGFGIAAVGFLIGTSVIILPAFGGYKYYKRRKMKRMLKRHQELMKIRSKNAMLQYHRARLEERVQSPRVLGVSNYHQDRMTASMDPFSRTMPAEDVGVHIGIQTGNSQQVDVTVHTPYRTVTDDNTHLEENSSEVTMNICDENGQVTVTTAEITHNPTSGDGSEADVVLHVVTTYPKEEKEVKRSESNKKEVKIAESNKIERKGAETSKKEGKGAETSKKEMTSAESSKKVSKSPKSGRQNDKKDRSKETDSKSSKSDSSSVKSDSDSKDSSDSDQTQTDSKDVNITVTKSKSSVFHRRAHSTGSLKKPSKKQEFGSLSMKNKHMLQKELLDQTYSPPPVPFLDLGQSEDLSGENKHPDDTDQNENEALSQSGCFMKIFGKKFQSEKVIEKEKVSPGVKNLASITGDCPDVVSCALEAELKQKDNSGNGENELDITKDYDPDKLNGLIAQETHTTSF